MNTHFGFGRLILFFVRVSKSLCQIPFALKSKYVATIQISTRCFAFFFIVFVHLLWIYQMQCAVRLDLILLNEIRI